jgi:cytochrome d ubiquinol oxidase subunit I
MDDLFTVVDWSRWQFALTAMYHWLFVPLTIGLALIVAIMESIYVKTKATKWLAMTKFWMLLFGINFAIGVATGIILEFEFGTNWSNYSWFVGDIFGAPLAIEGIVAFFMESTFVAVMFFGWKKFSPGFHLAASWLTAIGTSLSALWILVANAWMQQPVGMEFDPAQMRNVMVDFAAVVGSGTAVAKFTHAVASAWTLAGVFVIGVSSWWILRRRNVDMALDSIKVASWVGGIGILVTLATGDTSAVNVAKHQPMKLAAMEGLYRGSCGQELIGVGILNPNKTADDDAEDAYLFDISIPYGLSILANHDANSFVPGINDLIDGIELTAEGDTVRTVGYAERIERGRAAHEALRAYDAAIVAGDSTAMDTALAALKADYPYFGYGYLNSPTEAVPPVGVTFYAFRIMVMAGGYLMLLFIFTFVASYKRKEWLKHKVACIIGMISIVVVWVCSQAGWITAEVGRQPWVIQDLLPTRAAISDIAASSVITTFCMFAVVFTVLLVAEMSIMASQINKYSKEDIDQIAKS